MAGCDSARTRVYRPGMRWDELFADLEFQLAATDDADRDAEVAERIRIEDSAISWQQRLRSHVGNELELEVRAFGRLPGSLARVGVDFAVLTGPGQAFLVPLHAVVCIGRIGAGADSSTPSGAASRLGLGSALRTLARDRTAVTVYLVDGQALTGTPARVGSDYVEVAIHPVEDGPRKTAVSSRRVVPFPAVAVVRLAGSHGWT